MVETITVKIMKALEKAGEPLETLEITNALMVKDKTMTRAKVIYRLNALLAEGLVNGKSVGSGKGCWIWWTK